MYLVLSAFTSIPISSLATTKSPAVFFAVGCSRNFGDRKYNLSRSSGYDVVLLGKWLATFRSYMSLSTVRVQCHLHGLLTVRYVLWIRR
jgi:hypothetical protein